MTRYLVAYLAAAAAMAILDVIWLRSTLKLVYEPAIGALLGEHTNMAAAVWFYVLYVLGIMVFAVGPAFRGGDCLAALVAGGAFGFFAYVTYDLSNMATLKLWPAHLAAIDISWGSFLTATAASAGYAAGSLVT